jgi:CSLREA domain-containing protein
VIAVNTTEDELNSDGDCSLREAVQAANTDTAVDACPAGSGDDTIALPANTYTLSIPSTDEDANVNGDLDIASDIVLQGTGATTTIIQAGTSGDNGIARVLHVLDGGELTVAHVTVQYGLAAGRSPHNRGGGIYNDGGTVTVTDSNLHSNRADGSHCAYGGGIYNNGGTVIVTNSTLIRNRVEYFTGGRGGGIFNRNGVVILDNSTLEQNGVQAGLDGYGGGVHNSGGTVTVVNCALDDNRILGDTPLLYRPITSFQVKLCPDCGTRFSHLRVAYQWDAHVLTVSLRGAKPQNTYRVIVDSNAVDQILRFYR